MKIEEVISVPVVFKDTLNKSANMMMNTGITLTFNVPPALLSDGTMMIVLSEIKQAVERMMTKAINTK